MKKPHFRFDLAKLGFQNGPKIMGLEAYRAETIEYRVLKLPALTKGRFTCKLNIYFKLRLLGAPLIYKNRFPQNETDKNFDNKIFELN